MLVPRIDRVIIKSQTAEKSAGGIFLPESAQQRGVVLVAKVVAVPDGVKDLKEGDTVLAPKHLILQIEYLGDKYEVIDQKDIMCIVKPEILR
jgi:co-chaperonin GroES (HSP10)